MAPIDSEISWKISSLNVDLKFLKVSLCSLVVENLIM